MAAARKSAAKKAAAPRKAPAKKAAAKVAGASSGSSPGPSDGAPVHTLTPGKTRRLKAARRCPSGRLAKYCPDCEWPDPATHICHGLRFAEGVEV